MSRRRAVLGALAALAITSAPALALAPGAAAATPRTSLTAIWNDVMCVACHEPLSVAESPQAIAERQYIRHLILLGYTKPQILRELVVQYGPAVLGKPPAHGFNLTVYILPPAIVALGLLTLALTLPAWRRRTRASAAQRAVAAAAISPVESRRLDEELGRFGG